MEIGAAPFTALLESVGKAIRVWQLPGIMHLRHAVSPPFLIILLLLYVLQFHADLRNLRVSAGARCELLLALLIQWGSVSVLVFTYGRDGVARERLDAGEGTLPRTL